MSSFRVGDLVRIDGRFLVEGEPCCALILRLDPEGRYLFETWGSYVAGECDCECFWKGDVVPFNSEMFIEVVGCSEDRET